MSRLWILVVDDQEPVRDLIADILVAEGHYVRTVENSAHLSRGREHAPFPQSSQVRRRACRPHLSPRRRADSDSCRQTR